MRVRTVEDAQALIGRTFEVDGQQRTVTRIENLRENKAWSNLFGEVYWKRPGGKERKRNVWLPYFNEWLSKATEVQQETT